MRTGRLRSDEPCGDSLPQLSAAVITQPGSCPEAYVIAISNDSMREEDRGGYFTLQCASSGITPDK